MTGAWEDPKIIEFVKQLKKHGFTDVRLFIHTKKSLYLAVQCQSLKHYEYGDTELYFVEAVWKGEYCCAYTDSLEDKEEIFGKLEEAAGIFDNRSIPEHISKSADYRGQRWRDIDGKETAAVLKYAERKALSCQKAHFVERCVYHQFEETVTFLDEHMNYLADDDGDCTFSIRVIAEDEGCAAASTKLGIVDVQDKAAFQEAVCKLAGRAAEYARFGLHAERPASGSYPVILENCVMAELTGHYLPVFYGENINDHTSVLTGREKSQVGCPLLHLEEDPFSPQGARRRRIDDEGVTVSKKVLLRNGVFEDILYNKKSAHLAGRKSTGNGFKPSITGDIGTSATNVILSSEGSIISRKGMLEASEGGIYITQIEGMFAGTDTESGDFSLLASGNRIIGGEISTAVHQFTISGNICELWIDIEMIGDDPVYRILDGGCVIAPSVKIRKLMVSGE